MHVYQFGFYNINLQICENHSTNHSITFPMDGPVECLKVLPCVDINHRPHVTFLGPQDAWRETAHKYKHLFEMDTKLAYYWLTFWVNANHPSFKECTIDESEDVQTKMNNVTNCSASNYNRKSRHCGHVNRIGC